MCIDPTNLTRFKALIMPELLLVVLPHHGFVDVRPLFDQSEPSRDHRVIPSRQQVSRQPAADARSDPVAPHVSKRK
jgi:hypothetical protein